MRLGFRFLLLGLCLTAVLMPASAQNAISAKAGMINVVDGDVYMVDAKGGEPQRVQPKINEFIDIKEGYTLKTGEGRSEVLLSPGAFLRMADDSSFRLLSNRLTQIRLETLTGSQLIEVTELIDGNEITVHQRNAVVSIVKGGLYRFDGEPSRVRVYQGEAIVEVDGQKVNLRSGRQMSLGSNGWVQAKFDQKDTDALYRWAKRRSGYIAMANVSAARQAGTGTAFAQQGSWAFNPYFGFWTYLPYSNTMMNPFGYYYYTPSTVMTVYYPPRQSPSAGFGGHGVGLSNQAGYVGRSASSAYVPSSGISHSAVSAPSANAGSVGSHSSGASSGAVSSATATSGGGGMRGGK